MGERVELPFAVVDPSAGAPVAEAPRSSGAEAGDVGEAAADDPPDRGDDRDRDDDSGGSGRSGGDDDSGGGGSSGPG